MSLVLEKVPVSMKRAMHIYQRGPATLYLGDCREILQALEPTHFAGCVVDPPYSIEWKSGWTADGRPIAGDDSLEIRDCILEWSGTSLPVACFGSWKLPPPPGAKGRIVWDKGHAVGMGDLSFPWFSNAEDCYLLGHGWVGERRDSVIRCRRAYSGTSEHPHEKPVELLSRIMETMPEGAIIDPCAGSGSVGIAALQSGRPYVGIEIDEKYFQIMRARIDAELAQGKLFE